jgi:hypothetical protein
MKAARLRIPPGCAVAFELLKQGFVETEFTGGEFFVHGPFCPSGLRQALPCIDGQRSLDVLTGFHHSAPRE